MSETKSNGEKKTLTLTSKKLGLKKADGGQVRQSFSHGRSKSVAVEVKKKRTFGTTPAATPEKEEAYKTPNPSQKKLTKSELDARKKVLESAEQIRSEEEEKRRVEAEARQKLEEEQRAKSSAKKQSQEAEPEEEEPAQETPAEPEAERPALKVEEPMVDLPPNPEKAAAQKKKEPVKHVVYRAGASDEEDNSGSKVKSKKGVRVEVKRSSTAPRRDQSRKLGRTAITRALEGDDSFEGRTRSMAALRRAREREKAAQAPVERFKVYREVDIPDAITVAELASRMTERGADVIKTLMNLGMMVTINQIIDADTAELVCTEMGHTPVRIHNPDVEIGLDTTEDTPESLKPRAPVVTIMGHVDHGKTSLLDAIRSADVASGEAGGITQHIGAYQIETASKNKITFIDTPGHAAFTEMRSRGANVTDIVILVVAADDGVKDQTIEAINHAKAAGVPIIVAINKIDKPDANPTNVRNELLQYEIVLEEYGGETLAIEVSAKEKQNLDKLEEAILLQAEMLNLTANPDRNADGVVVEAKVDKGRGAVATTLVQRGTLKVGDIVAAGTQFGRVRALIDDHGQRVNSAGPSIPVEVLGFDGAPQAGDKLLVVEDDATARELTEYRTQNAKDMKAASNTKSAMEQMMSHIASGDMRELPVVIKTDVQGSLEAISASLEKLATDEVKVTILHSGVGGINESDISLAEASNGLVIAFNVRANPQARDHARQEGVEIRYYSIIYNVIDDAKALMSGLLAPTLQETFLGYAEIREVFSVSKVGNIAGCYVTEGTVKRGCKIRILRDDVVIHEGDLKSLKRFKEEVKEVRENYECGMAFENYNDIKVGDKVECFEMTEIARKL